MSNFNPHGSAPPSSLPPATQTAVSTLATPHIPRAKLLQAATECASWFNAVAPGSKVFICGGLALAMHGNHRHTTDADLGIDLSMTKRPDTNRPFDTNRLKQLAAQDPYHRFSVGPKIYWILNPGSAESTPIQIDFVDANLFWAPFDPQKMLNIVPNSSVMVLNLQTLLVSKMRSAIERSQANPRERMQKQLNDLHDFHFALSNCIYHNMPLAAVQWRHLGSHPSTALAVIRDFWKLAEQMEFWNGPPSTTLKELWMKLIVISGAPQEFVTGSST